MGTMTTSLVPMSPKASMCSITSGPSQGTSGEPLRLW